MTMAPVFIFNLDDIVDTTKYHHKAWSMLASELDIAHALDSKEPFRDISRMSSLNILLNRANMDELFSANEKELLAESKNRTYINYVNKIESSDINKDVVELVKTLKKLKVKTVLTSISKNVLTVTSKLKLTKLFSAVVDGNMISEGDSIAKIYILAAEALGVEPKDCIVCKHTEPKQAEAHMVQIKHVPLEKVVGMATKRKELSQYIESITRE